MRNDQAGIKFVKAAMIALMAVVIVMPVFAAAKGEAAAAVKKLKQPVKVVEYYKWNGKWQKPGSVSKFYYNKYGDYVKRSFHGHKSDSKTKYTYYPNGKIKTIRDLTYDQGEKKWSYYEGFTLYCDENGFPDHAKADDYTVKYTTDDKGYVTSTVYKADGEKAVVRKFNYAFYKNGTIKKLVIKGGYFKKTTCYYNKKGLVTKVKQGKDTHRVYKYSYYKNGLVKTIRLSKKHLAKVYYPKGGSNKMPVNEVAPFLSSYAAENSNNFPYSPGFTARSVMIGSYEYMN